MKRYTGSAGWLYRLIIESLLGLRLEVNTLYVNPRCRHRDMGFTMHYRYRNTVYEIRVAQKTSSRAALRVRVDGVPQQDPAIALFDDNQTHEVKIDINRLKNTGYLATGLQ